MSVKFTDLQCKEVICVSNGQRLGFISDVLVELPEGKVCAVVVPGPCHFLGLAGQKDDFIIPWDSIERVGPDIVLVKTRPDDCRVPRHRQWKGSGKQ
ncbi:MAG: PRC-barrel domain-containing protein [Faecousia sp.]